MRKFFILGILIFPTVTFGQIDSSGIVCSKNGCIGTYFGPEFNEKGDIAHQFSNTMSAKVGDQLKLLYSEKHYVKVDFRNIVMTTIGMGSDTVSYHLSIPFVAVKNECEAFTSFDHCGGWNHSPAIAMRKKALSKVLLKGDRLYISKLKTTPEGLQEYWIQWRNKEIQGDCESM
ncbi:MAG: hypothetical protein KJ941_04750 [Bacteroidetes bacterium]|nr:hypothetical protein [Bacteroidota bacterium]